MSSKPQCQQEQKRQQSRGGESIQGMIVRGNQQQQQKRDWGIQRIIIEQSLKQYEEAQLARESRMDRGSGLHDKYDANWKERTQRTAPMDSPC